MDKNMEKINEITENQSRELDQLLTSLSHKERIAKLTSELAKLKTERAKLENWVCVESGSYRENDNWWKLDARVKATEMILDNLTSVCQFCHKAETELTFPRGDKYHRDCLKKLLVEYN